MENRNISYRRLRLGSKVSSGKLSAPNLKKSDQKNSKKEEDKRREFSIMSQNVTNYEHMLKNPHMKQKYIHWVIRLREPITFQQSKGENSSDFQVPSVFNKKTLSYDNFLKARKTRSVKSFNSAIFYDTISRKQCQKHLQENNLNYMINLRDSRDKESQIKSETRTKFSCIPFKQRGHFPEFLSKQAMRKCKGIEKAQKETAFDGAQNFQPYPQKIMTENNFNCFKVFTGGEGKASFPTIAWQMGLRS